ncbi:MAG: YqjF family protein, partial [Stackebrandtia sp.]
QGRRGVVFRSLDATRLVPVLGARVSARLPYKWSAMSLRRADDVITYRCRRIWPGPLGAGGRMVVRVREAIPRPGRLELFLTARWGLHVSWYGRTLYVPNDHPRWDLYAAELLDLDDRLVTAAGLSAPAAPPASVLYAPGVPVRFGIPSPVA